MTNELERLKRIYPILNRRFIILRKVYILGVVPKLLCVLREEHDGYVTEKRIPFRMTKGDYPACARILKVRIGEENLAYCVTKEAADWLNVYDKPVYFKINNPEPWLGGYVIKE